MAEGGRREERRGAERRVGQSRTGGRGRRGQEQEVAAAGAGSSTQQQQQQQQQQQRQRQRQRQRYRQEQEEKAPVDGELRLPARLPSRPLHQLTDPTPTPNASQTRWTLRMRRPRRS